VGEGDVRGATRARGSREPSTGRRRGSRPPPRVWDSFRRPWSVVYSRGRGGRRDRRPRAAWAFLRGAPLLAAGRVGRGEVTLGTGTARGGVALGVRRRTTSSAPTSPAAGRVVLRNSAGDVDELASAPLREGLPPAACASGSSPRDGALRRGRRRPDALRGRRRRGIDASRPPRGRGARREAARYASRASRRGRRVVDGVAPTPRTARAPPSPSTRRSRSTRRSAPRAGSRRATLDAVLAWGPRSSPRPPRARPRGGSVPRPAPARAGLLTPVLEWARERREVDGRAAPRIGGSSRGPQALAATRRARKPGTRGEPRLHVLDTVDPQRARDLLGRCPRRRPPSCGQQGGDDDRDPSGAPARRGVARARRRQGRARSASRSSARGANPMRARAAPRLPCFAVPRASRSVQRSSPPSACCPPRSWGSTRRGARRRRPRWRPGARGGDPAGNPALLLAAVHHLAWRSGRTRRLPALRRTRCSPSRSGGSSCRRELGSAGRGRGRVTPAAGRRAVRQHSLLQRCDRRPDRHLVVFVEPRTARRIARAPAGARRCRSPSGAASARSSRPERRRRARARRGGEASVTIRVPDTSRAPSAPSSTVRGGGHVWGRLEGIRPLRPAGRRARQGPDPRLADGRPAEASTPWPATGAPAASAGRAAREVRSPVRVCRGAACPEGALPARLGGLPPRGRLVVDDADPYRTTLDGMSSSNLRSRPAECCRQAPRRPRGALLGVAVGAGPRARGIGRRDAPALRSSTIGATAAAASRLPLSRNWNSP